MHSVLELYTGLRRSWKKLFFINFFFLGEVRFDYRREFKHVKEVLECLSRQNAIRFCSEIGFKILG